MTNKFQRFLLMSIFAQNGLIWTSEKNFIIACASNTQSQKDHQESQPSHVSATPSCHSPESRTHSSDLDDGSIDDYRPKTPSDSESQEPKPSAERELFRSKNPRNCTEEDLCTQEQNLKIAIERSKTAICAILGLTQDQLNQKAFEQFHSKKDLMRAKIQRKLLRRGVKNYIDVQISDNNLPAMPSVPSQITPYSVTIFPTFYLLSKNERNAILTRIAEVFTSNQFGMDKIIQEAILMTLKENPEQRLELQPTYALFLEQMESLRVIKILQQPKFSGSKRKARE